MLATPGTRVYRVGRTHRHRARRTGAAVRNHKEPRIYTARKAKRFHIFYREYTYRENGVKREITGDGDNYAAE